MRESYMQEYQMNLDQNTSRRDDKITEISIELESQNSQMQDLEKEKTKFKSCLNGFLKRLYEKNKKRQCLNAWRVFFRTHKSTNSKLAYFINKS